MAKAVYKQNFTDALFISRQAFVFCSSRIRHWKHFIGKIQHSITRDRVLGLLYLCSTKNNDVAFRKTFIFLNCVSYTLNICIFFYMKARGTFFLLVKSSFSLFQRLKYWKSNILFKFLQLERFRNSWIVITSSNFVKH